MTQTQWINAILPRRFYDRDTVTVAKDLLGKHLIRILPDGTVLAGRITETEAYVGRMDKACHAYGYKRTARTETLFAQPGTAYVYLIYGMYCCLNFVTEAEGEPCAVLLRAVEPVGCCDLLSQLRFGCSVKEQTAYQRKNFLNGPGKVCQAFLIDRTCNHLDLTLPPLFVADGKRVLDIHTGKRIGIDYAEEAADFPWRFWV